MAKPVLKNKNQLQDPCLCFWLNSLGSPVKNMITGLISTVVNTAKAILLAAKTIGTLMTNIDKEIQIYSFETAINLEKAIMQPLQAPFALLTKAAQPYADCDYVKTFLTSIKSVKKTLFSRWTNQIKEFEDMVDSLEMAKKQWDGVDRAISTLTDINNAISTLCDMS